MEGFIGKVLIVDDDENICEVINMYLKSAGYNTKIASNGREAKKLPIGGKRPARIMQPAPVAIVKRLTTLVMLIRPTFCEKDVTGGHPNSAEIAEANPSQANEPDISSDLISRPKPPDTMAVVSPIVSAAETMKIIATEKMAPMLNSGV